MVKKIFILLCVVFLGAAGNSRLCAQAPDSEQWFLMVYNGQFLTYSGRFDIIGPYDYNIDSMLDNLLWSVDDKGVMKNRSTAIGGKYIFKSPYVYSKDLLMGKCWLYTGWKTGFYKADEMGGRLGTKVDLIKVPFATESEMSDLTKIAERFDVLRYVYCGEEKDRNRNTTLKSNLEYVYENYFKYKSSAFGKPQQEYKEDLEWVIRRGEEAVDNSKKGANVWLGQDMYGNELYVENLSKSLYTYSNGTYNVSYETVNSYSMGNWPDQAYSDPFESCIPRPKTAYTLKIRPDQWTIKIVDQIQTNCKFDNNGHPVKPTIPEDASRLGSYDSFFYMLGADVPCKVTRSRNMYQTPRTNKRQDRHGNVYTMYGSDADPFAPWRIVETSTYVIDINKVSELLHMSKQLIAYMIIRNGCRDFHPPKLERNGVIASLYKTYKLSDITGLRNDMQTAAKRLEELGMYSEAIDLHHLMDNKIDAVRLCDIYFNSCTGPVQLRDAFLSVCQTISPDFYERGYMLDYFFAGMPRFNIGSMYDKSYVNCFSPDAADTYLGSFWKLRDKFFSDMSYYEEFDQDLKRIYQIYMNSALKPSVETLDFYNYIRDCQDKTWMANVEDYMSRILALELDEIKTLQFEIKTIDAAYDLKKRVERLEEYAKYEWNKVVTDLDLKKVRTRMEYIIEILNTPVEPKKKLKLFQ